MKLLFRSVSLIGLMGLTSLSCHRVALTQVNHDVETSLKANESAKSFAEWESSEHNNEAIFKRWKDSAAEPQNICETLLVKSGKDLSLFEEQINSEEYKTLIEPCKKDLHAKIEAYWTAERKNLKELSDKDDTAPFKFPLNVQTRDVSSGYRGISGGVAPKELILSFDDGPHILHTEVILAALEAVDAKAMFFSLGKNAKSYPEILRHVGRNGHSIGSHSIDHKCLPASPICEKNNGVKLTYDQALAEIRGGHQEVEKALGWVDPFFRFPYGESSPELRAFLDQNSVGDFYWSIDSEDWKNRTPAEMLKFTIASIDKKGSGIVLMHDIQRKTAEVLPELLKQLYFKGYTLVILISENPHDRFQSKLTHPQ